MNAAPLAAPPSPAPRRRWLIRLVGLTIVAAVVAVAAAPSIVSWSPALRNALLRRAVGDIHGEVVVQDLSVGWFAPLAIKGLELRPLPGGNGPGTAGGETLVAVERIESDRTLWQMIWTPREIGTVRIERPDVFVKLTDTGSNFQEVFEPILAAMARPTEPGRPPGILRFGIKARIVDGTLRGISQRSRQPWKIAPINLGVGVRPASASSSGKAELLVDHGALLAKQEISVGLCNDIFQYIAPPVGRVAQAKGMVSLDLDDWRLPWNDFGGGDLSGRLTMHSVEVGPGPITESYIGWVERTPLLGELYRKLQVPAFVQIARESTVPFKMLAGGRIYHENLRFSVAEFVDVQSQGTVGLDESLDLVTALGVHPPNPDDRRLALLRTLASQSWPVQVRGSIGKPVIDFSPLNDAWKQLVFQKLPQDWQSGRSSVGAGVLDNIAERTGAPVDSKTVGTLLQLIGPMLSQAGSANSPKPPAPALPSATSAPPAPPAAAPTPTGPKAAGPKAAGTSVAGQVAEGVGVAVDVLEAIRARRQAALERQRLASPPEAPSSPETRSPQPQPTPTPPRRRLIGTGLRMLLDAAEQPPPAPAPPAPSPTPSATPSATAK